MNKRIFDKAAHENYNRAEEVLNQMIREYYNPDNFGTPNIIEPKQVVPNNKDINNIIEGMNTTKYTEVIR